MHSRTHSTQHNMHAFAIDYTFFDNLSTLPKSELVPGKTRNCAFIRDQRLLWTDRLRFQQASKCLYFNAPDAATTSDAQSRATEMNKRCGAVNTPICLDLPCDPSTISTPSPHHTLPSKTTTTRTPSRSKRSNVNLANIPCMVCSTADGPPNKMLVCDTRSCLGSLHFKCCSPPLKHLPRGDWYCPKCIPEE